MTEYLKALVPLAVGLVLVVAGVVLPDETLRQLGYGFLGGGLTAGVVPNKPR